MYPHTYKNSSKSICLFIGLALLFAAIFAPHSTGVSPSAPAGPAPEATASVPPGAFGRLPLSFEPNQGQTDARVKFLARGQGYGIFLTDNDALLSFSGSQMRMRLQGASTSPQITGVDQLPGKVNYLLGNKSENWQTNIPTYARVRYQQVYPGVDLIYYGNQKQLEYDFVVEPGASFKQIGLAFDGAGKLKLNRHGDLILGSAAHKITLLRPKAYQEIDNKRREVSVRYLLKSRGQVAFQVGNYDKSRKLVIDPVLVYSTYLGGAGQDTGSSIAVDSSGNAYITGQTAAVNFPTASPLQSANGGSADVFVAKLNAAGSALIYSTYLGGSGVDVGTSIAIDATGNAYITGQTTSLTFPTVNPLHPALKDSADAFVAELNTTGSALVYSTYLGGHSTDAGNSITVDAGGNAYVTGSTSSPDFPTTSPLQANRSGSAIFKTTDGAANWAASDAGLSAAAVSDMAFQPGNSSIVYAATDVGLFKSTDSGGNWTHLTGLVLPVNNLAIDPTSPSILYVSTFSGLFRSTDGGNTFTGINNGFPTFGQKILVDPVTPTTLYAISFGSSLFKSVDAGQNWTESVVSFNAGLVNDIAVGKNSTLYAGTTFGIFKSTNGGVSWSPSNGLLSNPRINSIVADNTNNLLYAATNFGLFKSSDAAVTWTNISGNLDFTSFFKVAFDPSNTSTIYASTGFPRKTTDGGATWNFVNTGYPNTTINSLVLNPTQPATLFIGTNSGADVFVTKLSAGGSSLAYSTYLGGSLSEAGNGIAVDAAGNAYVTGSTSSDNFPTANAFQPTKVIGTDAFVTKLNANGSALIYSTFLGGGFTDIGRAIAVDINGNAYVAGSTNSADFPVFNAFQASMTGFQNDGFVTKINAAGAALVYSTFLGGDANDDCLGIAVDSAGRAYVTGSTGSENFPTLGGLQPTKAFNSDAFVTKFAANGSTLINSTYLGGSGVDVGAAIALDSSNNIYVTGTTTSTNFPTVNPLQATNGGSRDVFISKLAAAPEVGVTMTDSPDPVNFGSNVTYTMTVTNNGEIPATNVTLTDTRPAGAPLISATASVGTCTGTSPIICTLGTMNPGATATVTVVVTAPPVRTIVNTATVTLTEADAFPANNTATAETLVDFADLSITKKAAQNLVAPGGTLTYSLIVKNKSGIAAPATVTDNLPANTSFIKCAATGNGVCGGSGNNVSVTFPELAVGASEAIVLTVSVSGSASEGAFITNTASVSSPVPDSNTLDNSSPYIVTVSAVPLQPKANGLIAFESDRQFTPNPQPDGIYTIKPDGTDEKLFPGIPSTAQQPEWSPNGTQLAFQAVNFGGNSPVNEINVINADGTGLVKIANNTSNFNRHVTWSPSGDQIAYIGNSPSNNNDGIRAVHIANADGSGFYRLPGSPTFLSSVDWSPDGRKFVYADDREIFVMNADATNQTKITTITQTLDGPTTDLDPRWSPDGTKILLTRVTNNTSGIYVMNADGSNLRKLFNFRAGSPSWSPDGLSVVLVESNEIATVNLDNTNFKYLTFNNQNNFSEFSPTWQKVANPNPTPTPTPAPTFSLSGNVTSANGPIFLSVGLSGPVNALISTDNAGNYEFVNLPAGQYTITPISIFFSFAPPSRTVTISNANITGLDFTGTFVPANITGHVKDNNGNPLPGIKITSTGGFPEGSTFTDANGFYSFPNVQRHRNYFIFPDPFTAYSFAPEFKSIFDLTETETVVDFVATKQPANVIAGRVIETVTGQGIPGIQVSLAQSFGFAASTFTDSNGNFSFGERKSNKDYEVAVGPNQFFIFEPAVNAPNPFARIEIPSLTTDQNLLFTGTRRNTLQFSAAGPSVNEGSGFATITITRTGDLISPATINFTTSDSAGLAGCTVVNGKSSERCDYGTTAGTLRFAAGETSKSIVIPIVDDAHVEGNETFTIALSNPVGAQPGAPVIVTATIIDNDGTPATQNPIDGVVPFVTQQYIDFLGRLPDATGLANWVDTLNKCPNSGFGENDNPTCDRVHVSSGFFLSEEFRVRGYWAYRFFEVGLDRRPLYVEFVQAMAQVGGAQSPESEILSKAAYTDAFVQRLEFTNRYNGLTNAEFVNALELNAEITLGNKAELIAALNGNQKTRGQVLREIVESKAVEDKFFIRAFVAMQYFGYLRRDPDTIGYNNWVTTLTADPSNFRHMIFGFLFSNEYRGRFGP
jgi:uncharacterized repeat protein (TIGR01451 family)